MLLYHVENYSDHPFWNTNQKRIFSYILWDFLLDDIVMLVHNIDDLRFLEDLKQNNQEQL